MAKVKTIVNKHITPTKNVAEISFQVSSATENGTIDWEERNYRGSQLSIFTGTGGTGTQLIKGTDYSLVNLNDSITSDADVNVYSGVNVTNATYHDIDLYIPINSIDLYGDSLDASDINRFQEQFNLLPSGVDTVIATDGQTINLTATKTIIYTDTTLANVTITLGTAFDGAEWIVISEGGNLTYVKGTGLHNTGTTGTPCNMKIKGDYYDGAYYPNNEITAKYTSGSYKIEQGSKGDISEIYTSGVLTTSILQSTPIYSSTTITIVNLIPMTFDKIDHTPVGQSGAGVWVATTTGSTIVRLMSINSGYTGLIRSTSKGEY